MKTMVNAMLSFGLINVPVGVASYASKKETRMRQLHRECSKPINLVKKCNHHGVELIDSDIVHGVEITKGQYVVIEPEELEKFTVERSRTIQLRKFVPGDVVEAYVEKRFHLVPSTVSEGYRLLYHAIGEGSLAGIGQAALWGKESPIAVVAGSDGLMLQTLYCADEVNRTDDLRPVVSVGTDESQQKLAGELVKSLMQDFDPAEDLVSNSRNVLEAFIEAKVAGREPQPLMGFDAPTVATPDIAEQLRQSIAEAKKAKPKARKKVTA